MGKKEKLLKRFLSRPVDFSFEELTVLLAFFGYYPADTGKTGGSRAAFIDKDGGSIRLHRPHPGNELKRYQIDDVLSMLKSKGYL
jgi:hypothetical protein